MSPHAFERFFNQIDRDRKATAPYRVLVHLIGRKFASISPEQLARLEDLDTDILCVGKRRYTFGENPSGCWVYEMNEAGANALL